MPESPLAGLRVVESGGLAVAYAGKILAEGGADVLRVVSPAGDPLAAEPPRFGQSGISIQDTWYNLGKRTAEIDLDDRSGRAALAALTAGADVLIEEWAPGQLLGAEAETGSLLVRVSLTPMGRDQRQLRVNDLVANALSGSASVTGDVHTPPLSGYGNQTAHTVGMYAAICALAAWRRAAATGQGSHVDLSAHEALVSCTEQVLMQWFFPGTWPRIARRQGGLHWSQAYAIYPDRNGQGSQVTAAMRFMEAVLPWMIEDGMARDLTDPEQYPDFLAMVRNLPHVMDLIKAWVATKDSEEFFHEAQRRTLPFGAVFDIPKVLASPQIEARSYFADVEIAGAGTARMPGRLFATDCDASRPTPGVRVDVTEVSWPPKTGSDLRADTELASGRPLEAVRVLDFTHVLAGPFGTRVLGDLGADILKVGTGVRAGGANNPGHPYYICWNRNKRSINLDLSQARGRELARDLAAKCDAVTENFSAGVLSRWGLDRPAMRDRNPRLTVVSMGGMGQDGPWKDYLTFAPTIHALTGLTYLTNPPGEHLLGYGFSLTDHLSGLAGAIAVLEGIEHARRTGEGLAVDLSQYELGLHIMAPGLIDAMANGSVPKPVGNRHPFKAWAPHGIYRAAGDDRWVAIAVRGDPEWSALTGAMGRPELAADLRFATHENRVAHEEELDALVEDWTSTLDRYAVMAVCQGAGVAAGAVQDAEDLTRADPYLSARAFFGEAAASSGTEAHGIDRFPALFDGIRPDRYLAAEGLGADTFDVLMGVLGMDAEAIAELAADGILA